MDTTTLPKMCAALCNIKNVKAPMEECEYFSSWVFLTFFKLCKWYEMAQSISYRDHAMWKGKAKGKARQRASKDLNIIHY